MTGSKFVVEIPLTPAGPRSGDEVAGLLKAVAADLSSRYDGLILPEDDGMTHDANGLTARWAVR